MADGFIRLPDDGPNLGKKVHTRKVTTDDGEVHNHVFEVDSLPLPAGAATESTVAGLLTNAQLRATPVPVSGIVTSTGLTDTELRASPVPVSGPLTDTQLRATPVPISGTVATGGLTDAQLRATPVPVSGVVSTTGLTDTELRASPVPVSGPLTDTELRATPVPVSGPLTDTQLRATAVPVSGPLTDAQLRATPVPVSGTVTASGPLTDTQLRATPVPVSGPLTDTQLRTTPVPVSGTVTATGPLTDTQLRATPVPVSGPLTDTQLRATPVPVSAASLPLPSGAATESTLSARLSETDFDTKTGSLTETAPTTDTASSGLNGRLQRIAQRITTLLANFTAAGSPSANVLSIQGVASMTAVKTDGSGVTQPISNASEIADDAAFTVATSKTYPIGYHSVAHGTNPDAADALDAVNPITNRHRVPFMIGGHPNIQTVEYYAAGSTTQTAFKVITVSSGTKIVITMIEALVSNACTVNVKVRVGFGTSVIPTEPSSGATVAGMVLTHGAIAPGSGVVLGNGAGIVAVGGDDEDLILAHGVSTSGDVRLRVSYYTIES